MKGGAGVLDRRIAIEALEEGRDAAGGVVPAWMPFLDVWARFEPLAGRETFAAQQVQADADSGFTIRHPGVTISPKAHRVVFDGRIYDIRSALEVGRREGIAIQAQARAE